MKRCRGCGSPVLASSPDCPKCGRLAPGKDAVEEFVVAAVTEAVPSPEEPGPHRSGAQVGAGLLLALVGLGLLMIFGPLVSCVSSRDSGAFAEALVSGLFAPFVVVGLLVLVVGVIVLGVKPGPGPSGKPTRKDGDGSSAA